MAAELTGLPRSACFVGWDVCAHAESEAMMKAATNKNPDGRSIIVSSFLS
jgi:hypothetical protein